MPHITLRRQTKSSGQPSTFSRPTISPDSPSLQSLAQRMCQKFHWGDAGVKLFQLEATKAQLVGMDTMVHASTGSGKTAIAAGPHVLPEVKGMVTLFVSPLLTLHVEMTKTFKDKYGLEAIAVNSLIDGNTKKLYKDIVTGQYQIVLLAPEMLTHPRFVEAILKSSEFATRLLAVVVDEAHCVSTWGASFRKAYADIGIVRAFMPPPTPIVAMSGTLSPRIRRDVLDKLGFSSGKYLMIDIGNARPNVTLAVLPSKHSLGSFHDLYFVIPQNVGSLSDIPKTFIYCDDKDTGYDIVDYLRSLLPQEFWPCIRPFNASLTPQYREAAMEAFRRGLIRVMVCTEAAGMGCDIPDIQVVVQWKLPQVFSAFVQRAGRAARDPTLNGVAILIAEPSAYRVDPTTEALNKTEKEPQNPGGKRSKMQTGHSNNAPGPTIKRSENKGFKSSVPAAPELHDDSPGEGIYAFVQTTLCRRKIWDQVYKNSPTQPTRGVKCCDLCDPSFLEQFTFLEPRRQRQGPRIRFGVPDPGVIRELEKWREETHKRDFPTAMWANDGLLSDDFISKLAALGPIESERQISRVLEDAWVHWNIYGNALFTLLSKLNIPLFQPLPTRTRKPVDRDSPMDASDASKVSRVDRPMANATGKRKRDTQLVPAVASASRTRPAPFMRTSTPSTQAPPIVHSQIRYANSPAIQRQNLEREYPNMNHGLPLHFEAPNYLTYRRTPQFYTREHELAPTFPPRTPTPNVATPDYIMHPRTVNLPAFNQPMAPLYPYPFNHTNIPLQHPLPGQIPAHHPPYVQQHPLYHHPNPPGPHF